MAPKNPYQALNAMKFNDGGKPDYANIEELEKSFRYIQKEYESSEARSELEEVLAPVIGKINRIVAVGLGSPSDGKRSVFAQIALMKAAESILISDGTFQRIDMLQCDPAATRLDHRLYELLDIDTLGPGPEDSRPDDYIMQCLGKDIKTPSWQDKAPVSGVTPYVTKQTLLFMPHLPMIIGLKYVAQTSPAMIISDGIPAFWNYLVIRDPEAGYASHKTTKPFRDDWERAYHAFVKLRDRYIRRPLTKGMEPCRQKREPFFAYRPPPGPWVSGMTDLSKPNIDELVEDFVYQQLGTP